MQYSERFSDKDLARIVEEGLIYMCACPAQVAQTLRTIREMHRYQLNCLSDDHNDPRVHQTIADAATVTHALLEDCMEQILVIEQWDRATLTMPPNLRKRQMQELTNDSGFLEMPD